MSHVLEERSSLVVQEMNMLSPVWYPVIVLPVPFHSSFSGHGVIPHEYVPVSTLTKM